MQEIKDIRLFLHKTQKEMADILGISLSYYIKIECGYRKLSVNVLEELKRNFPNIDINIFFKSKHTNSVITKERGE